MSCVSEDYLTYEIVIYKITIFKKVVYPNQITKIKFIRTGWANKGAIIKVKKRV